jgi:hypothetical protein
MAGVDGNRGLVRETQGSDFEVQHLSRMLAKALGRQDPLQHL